MTCVTSSGRENLATLFRLLGVLQAPRELLFFEGSSSEFQASKRTRSKPDRVIVALRGGDVKSPNAMRFECIKGLGRVGPFPDATNVPPPKGPPLPKRPSTGTGGMIAFARDDGKRAMAAPQRR